MIDGAKLEGDVVEQFRERATGTDDDGRAEFVGGGSDDEFDSGIGLLFDVERECGQSIARKRVGHRARGSTLRRQPTAGGCRRRRFSGVAFNRYA